MAFGKLSALTDDHPVMCQCVGDLAGHVERAWLERCAGGTVFAAAAFGRQANAMRLELAGDNPSPLEQLLISRVVATWLQVQHADWKAAAFLAGGGSFAEGEYLTRRQDRAHKRHLAAIKTRTKERSSVRSRWR